MSDRGQRDLAGTPRPRFIDRANADRYQVRSTTEIARILRDLARQHTLVTAYPAQGDAFALTAVLAVDTKHGSVVLDQPADASAARLLTECSQIACVSSHGPVPVEFICNQPSAITFEGAPALLTALPRQLWRLQRRDAYRVKTPIAHPLQCRLARRDGTHFIATVADLSLGGIGLVDYPQGVDLEPAERLLGVRIALPGYGLIATDLEVRNIRVVERDGAPAQRRAGCAFLGLTAEMSATIQRYIHSLDVRQRQQSRPE